MNLRPLAVGHRRGGVKLGLQKELCVAMRYEPVNVPGPSMLREQGCSDA